MDFYVPIATEDFFRKCWIPAIKELNLSLTSCFQKGIDLSRKDLQELLNELKLIKHWSVDNLSIEETSHIHLRIDLLVAKLTETLITDETVVFIG